MSQKVIVQPIILCLATVITDTKISIQQASLSHEHSPWSPKLCHSKTSPLNFGKVNLNNLILTAKIYANLSSSSSSLCKSSSNLLAALTRLTCAFSRKTAALSTHSRISSSVSVLCSSSDCISSELTNLSSNSSMVSFNATTAISCFCNSSFNDWVARTQPLLAMSLSSGFLDMVAIQWPLLRTWFNFNPSMDK